MLKAQRCVGELQPREVQILDSHGKEACIRFVASSRKTTMGEAERLIESYQRAPQSPGG